MTTKRTAKAATGQAQRTPDQQTIYELLRDSKSKRYQAVADTAAGAEFVATVAAYLPKIRAAYAHMDETQMGQPSIALRQVNGFWNAAKAMAEVWKDLDAAQRLVVASRASQFPGWPSRQDGDTDAAFVAHTGQHIKGFVAPFAGRLNAGLEMDPDKMESGVLYVGSCPREQMKTNLDRDAILYLQDQVKGILKVPAGVNPTSGFIDLADDFLGKLGRGGNTLKRAKEAVRARDERFYFRPDRG